MKTSYVWMCYDLGIRGDYDSLFEFLDRYKAKECGDNLAAFLFPWKKDAFAELKKAFASSVKLQPRSRIYVIVPNEKGGYKGKFLKGTRKAPPWTGYAEEEETEEEESSGEQ